MLRFCLLLRVGLLLRVVVAVLCIALPSFAAAPNAATSAATSITTSSAALNGSGTPNNEATTGWFRISQTNPVTCDDVFGTRVPTVDGTDLGSGAVAIPYSITATGLTSGNTYYYCAIVQNTSGKAYGIIQSFQVPGPPAVTTNTQTLLTATSATLNGAVIPTGASTTGFFRYSSTNPGTCNNSFGTVTANNSLGSGYSSVGIAQAISSLTPVTTYYYCAIATNTHGTTLGSLLSFTTPATAPVTTTLSANPIAGSSVTLRGRSNPGGATTTGWFRYSTVSPGTCNDSFGTRAPASGGTDLGAGLSNVNFSEVITGLTQNTTYYACAISENSVSKTFGTVDSFTTPMPPTVVTTAITTVDFDDDAANLRGAATPNRATTTGWFRYSTTNPVTCDDTFGTRAPASGGTDLSSGTSSVPFFQFVTGLSPLTTYYYCAIAENGEGKVFGSVQSFLTEGPPVATTNAETSLTATSVTLQGAGTPNGITTTAWFRYSTANPGTCNNSFGTQVPGVALNIGAGYAAFPYTYPLTGLTPNTTYYYCAIVNNPYGTSFGQVESFTTLVALPTVVTGVTTLVTGTTAQLNGSANPGGGATTGWFRYATTSPG
ncbi:MAG TPA: hypothetical protein VHO25_14595, partial [Polyangiaceae bacterium]|nr:hypothetical protein [Polyangiaceae bacterium]